MRNSKRLHFGGVEQQTLRMNGVHLIQSPVQVDRAQITEYNAVVRETRPAGANATHSCVRLKPLLALFVLQMGSHSQAQNAGAAHLPPKHFFSFSNLTRRLGGA